MMRSRDEAVRKLMARVDFGQGARDGDFLQEDLPLDGLPANLAAEGRARSMWRASGGKFDRERLAPLLERALNGRFVLVEASPERPSHGDQGCRQRPVQARRILARTLDRQSRRGPARLRLRQVDRQLLPRGGDARARRSLGNVDAVINWPQQSRRSFRYQRLLVPFSGDGNSTMLMAASLADPAINLRVKPG